MTSWKDDLARRIADLKDDDWEESPVLIPTGTVIDETTVVHRIKSLVVAIPPTVHRTMTALISRINAAPFCNAPAHCLMIDGFSFDSEGPKIRFLLRSVPWDQMFGLDTGEYRRIVDSAGHQLYDAVDFDEALPD